MRYGLLYAAKFAANEMRYRELIAFRSGIENSYLLEEKIDKILIITPLQVVVACLGIFLLIEKRFNFNNVKSNELYERKSDFYSSLVTLY